jgi:hypothetical protein
MSGTHPSHGCAWLNGLGMGRQTPEMLALAYTRGTLSRVRELVDFARRLTHSLPRHVTMVEEARLRLAAAPPGPTNVIADHVAASTRLPDAFRTTDRMDNTLSCFLGLAVCVARA